MLKQDLQFNIENDLIVEMTNHDIAKQVLLEQEKHGSIRSLQIEVESLKRFMLELGYIPFIINEQSVTGVHGFIRGDLALTSSTREISLEDAVALHNNNLALNVNRHSWIHTVSPYGEPLIFNYAQFEFAHKNKILSKVGLQNNKKKKRLVSTLYNIDVNFTYK